MQRTPATATMTSQVVTIVSACTGPRTGNCHRICSPICSCKRLIVPSRLKRSRRAHTHTREREEETGEETARATTRGPAHANAAGDYTKAPSRSKLLNTKRPTLRVRQASARRSHGGQDVDEPRRRAHRHERQAGKRSRHQGEPRRATYERPTNRPPERVRREVGRRFGVASTVFAGVSSVTASPAGSAAGTPSSRRRRPPASQTGDGDAAPLRRARRATGARKEPGHRAAAKVPPAATTRQAALSRR